MRRNVVIYGRKHRIIDCDEFTRSFLENEGISVAPPEAEPEDFFRANRDKVSITATLCMTQEPCSLTS